MKVLWVTTFTGSAAFSPTQAAAAEAVANFNSDPPPFLNTIAFDPLKRLVRLAISFTPNQEYEEVIIDDDSFTISIRNGTDPQTSPTLTITPFICSSYTNRQGH